jgi:hypothetical protein
VVSAKLLLLGSALCLSACATAQYPTIRPVTSHADMDATPFQRAYAEGKAQLAANHAGLAIVAFERAVQLESNSVEALNGIGAAFDTLKRYDVAMGYYQRALKLAPRDAATMNNIAVSLRLSGNPAAADWLDKAAKLDPGNQVIAANILQATAETAPHDAAPEPPVETASATPPQPDAGPRIEQSGVNTFELGLPGGTTPANEPAAVGAEPVITAAVLAQPHLTVPVEHPAAPPPTTVSVARPEAIEIAKSTIARVEPVAIPMAAENLKPTVQRVEPAIIPVAAVLASTRPTVAAEHPPVPSPAKPTAQRPAAESPKPTIQHMEPVTIPFAAVSAAPRPAEPPEHAARPQAAESPKPTTARTEPIAIAVAAVLAPPRSAQPSEHSAQPPAAKTQNPTTARVTVSNCVGRAGMAKRFRTFFRAEGLPVLHITNSPQFDCQKTRLLAHAGHERQAQTMAQLIPHPIEVDTDDTITDDIRLVLGRDLLGFDQTLGE